MKNQLTRALLCLGVALALSSCQRTIDDPEPSSPLLANRWMLVQVDATPLAVSSYYEDYKSYIQFLPGERAQGLAACDDIQGKFALDTSSGQLSLSQLTVKKGSCTSPVFGPRYLAALPQTSRYTISNDTLRLYAAQQATPRLIFKAAP